ncbi:MAG: helix-turn-helix transcriptional regulator [Flavobacteriales bacterium]|nr:helix-turn-helix transcriptional regulator [Flavobacteriales bacterium]
MDLIDRFKYLMKLNNLTASAFADEIGVQRSSVSHILSGRNKPSLEFIQKIITRFPKVSADWLIAGVTNAEKQGVDIKETTPSKTAPSPTPSLKIKEIKKILIFYNDNSFEEFHPN